MGELRVLYMAGIYLRLYKRIHTHTHTHTYTAETLYVQTHRRIGRRFVI